MSACTMKSAMPPATHAFLRSATKADFLKKVCDTPSMIEARITRPTPMTASTMGAFTTMVRAAADEEDAGHDEQDAGDLQRIELLAEPGDREPQHADVAERGDRLRVGEVRDLQHAQPVDELRDEDHHHEADDERLEVGRGQLPEKLDD